MLFTPLTRKAMLFAYQAHHGQLTDLQDNANPLWQSVWTEHMEMQMKKCLIFMRQETCGIHLHKRDTLLLSIQDFLKLSQNTASNSRAGQNDSA